MTEYQSTTADRYSAVKEAAADVRAAPTAQHGRTLQSRLNDLRETLAKTGYKSAHLGPAHELLEDALPSPWEDTTDQDRLLEAARAVEGALTTPVRAKNRGTSNLVANAVGEAKRDMATRPHKVPGREPY